MGEVEADAGTVFELLCNLELIPEWDMLFKGARYLDFAREPSGHCEVATIHLSYGLPGASAFVSDRDFVLRTVRVWFPNGMHVLYCTSLGPEVAVEGDPGKTPCTIRGHMWDSGYVVVPTAGGCCLNITLQVDPKGWIPTSVVNFSLEAIPLNIDRIRSTLQQLGSGTLAQLPRLNRSQAEACGRLPPLHMLGLGGSALHAAAAAEARAKTAAAAAAAEVGGVSGRAGQWGGAEADLGGAWGAGKGRAAAAAAAAAACSEGSGMSEAGEELREWHDAESAW
ncbi:hypothetical protein OEZ86_000182 [Tetradesmus obliquus]|nr:hypothetical protein OEZ86_000182 [Tetradesmus obliquus]